MKHILEHVTAWLISRSIVIALVVGGAFLGAFLGVLFLWGASR